MNKVFSSIGILALAFLSGCGNGSADGELLLSKGFAAQAAGNVAVAQASFAAAQDAFAAAARACPTNFSVQLSLATTSILQGEPRTADVAARAALALDPSSAEARLAAGHAAYLLKDYARAKAEFGTVIADRDLPVVLRSQALASRAVVEMAEEDTVAARLSLMRAVNLDFKNAAAWYHLGYLSYRTFNYRAAAREQFEMACKLDPASVRTRRVMQTILPALRNEIAQAAADVPGASGRNPGRAAELLAEAVAAGRKGKDDAVRQKCEQAFAADPLSYEAAWAYAQTLAKVTGVKDAAKHVTRTLDVYRAARELKPAKRETCLTAARYALQNKRPQAACEFLSHALAHFPNATSVLDLYVEALQKLGTEDGARSAARYRAYRREL